MSIVPALRDRVRGALVAMEQRRDPRRDPWDDGHSAPGNYARLCNICGWHGESFQGVDHSESAVCPRCGSIARDRFVYHCFVKQVPYRAEMRVLETSPRLGDEYRTAMRRRFLYLSSDFDLRAHQGDLALDLQSMGLRSQSIDVVLSAHVLEHLPDTERALAELRRVLRRSGHLILSVPIQQGWTAPPKEPEYHGDQTLVYWRFGLDFSDRLREYGFRARLLVPAEFKKWAKTGRACWGDESPEFDSASIRHASKPEEMVIAASPRVARRLGFRPGYMFSAWDCMKI